MGAIAGRVGAGFSIVLMALAGFGLLRRLIRGFTGRETLVSPLYEEGPSFRECAMVFCVMVLSRVFLYVWSLLLGRFEGLDYTLLQQLTALWKHWDARHYLAIAQYGYTAVGDDRLRLVFFPLYPWLVRLISWSEDTMFLTGMAFSVILAGGSAVLMLMVVWQFSDTLDVRETMMTFMLNPLSLFLCCFYTESLFLFLTLLCVVLRQRGHPWLSALAGMGSALTRMPGVIVAGFAVIQMLEDAACRRLTFRKAAGYLAQILIIFGGIAIYWGLNWKVTGDPFTYLVYQRENWYQEAGTFYHSVRNTIEYFLGTAGESDHWWTWGLQLFSIFYVLLLLPMAGALSFDLLAYSFVYILVVLSPTWLLSGPRYLFGMFTLPLIQGCVLKRCPGWLRFAHLVLSGVLLLLCTYGFTIAVEVL